MAQIPHIISALRPALSLLSLVAVACLPPAEAAAHPHVWIDARVEVKFEDDGQIQGLDVAWTFDEIYSLFAVEGLDLNEDGNLEPSELAPLVENSLKELKAWSYFTYSRSAEGQLNYGEPTKFEARYVDGYLTFQFEIPFATALDLSDAELVFKLYDPTYYIALDLARDAPVTLTANAPESCSYTVGDILDQPLSQSLFESNFDDPDKAQSLAESFASPVTISCSGSQPND